MRVGLVTYSTKPRGGVVHSLDLADALLEAGVDVEVIALGDERSGFFRDTKVPTVFVTPPPTHDSLEDRVFSSVEALDGGLRQIGDRYDIIHTQDCISARAACRGRDAGLSAFPIVLRTVHHVDDFSTEALMDCQRQAIVEPDALLVVSQRWQQILAAEYGRSSEVVHNGVNTTKLIRPDGFDRAAFRRKRALQQRFVFLTVGGIEPRKGTRNMFEALGMLKASMSDPPMLVIVGGHSFQDHEAYRSAALKRAVEMGLSFETDVIQAGTVSETELAEWYHASDAFLFPSNKEGWGLVALEALAVGLPLIASDIPVFREYLEHERTALLPAVGDSIGLAQSMERVMSDPDLSRRLRQAGAGVAERFTWAGTAEEHLRIYEKHLAAKSTSPTERRSTDSG